ncbi:DEAD/DEAH box helicase [Acinetobacter nosocomialis]|uniref:protein DpdE n=1 Tax=Acinetobacter nosocomialis TaxID=106654 RepID=UPI001AEA6FA2|nr:DEAD/DEAH box helicase [Acinetobacter nosocomialis]
MSLGELVVSTEFLGVGKVLGVNSNKWEIAFFHAPSDPYANVIEIEKDFLKKYKLYSEQVVYIRDQNTNLWRRARYIGPYGESRYLVVFRDDEKQICEKSEIFVLNPQNEWVDPQAFLEMQANDSPFFYLLRENFISSYIKQRSSCCSIGAILSSSIELEAHQLAVVKRVLQDSVKKYLLADEVGLGKTIETGILIREHVLNLKKDAQVLIVVPDHLVQQWIQELKLRFHLEDVMSSEFNDQPNVEVIGYQEYIDRISKKIHIKTMIVVDEMHQVASWAWSDNLAQQLTYYRLVNACEKANTVLLLSGTPLNGNEKNFLAMLHCLTPENYSLDEEGVKAFIRKIELSESLGGMRGALVYDNENTVIENILDELSTQFPSDSELLGLISELRPLVDFFDGVDQEDEIRKQKIKNLNHYIGERYRLHERMLRNRRDTKGLNVLFPGLAGASLYQWEIPKDSISLEYLILEYLSTYHSGDEEAYFSWISDLMISPQVILERCNILLQSISDRDECNLLEEILKQAIVEQKEKDQVLINLVGKELNQSSKLKMVIFVDDTKLSHYVYELLNQAYPQRIEHNLSAENLVFNNEDSDIQVLVCDQSGEDGLNLQGTERVVIHYAMTMSISRIEQRLGRVNRYCANLTGVKSIQSWILLPKYHGVYSAWIEVLDRSVGIFNRTMASLQYVLEEQFLHAWRKSIVHGPKAFDELMQILGFFQQPNSESLIELEFKKVRAQEELMAMDADVQRAVSFAEAISQSDERAEKDTAQMLDWIIEALQFKKKNITAQQFRLGYQNGSEKSESRTLLDIANFIKHCFLGIDSQNPPWTHVMSPSRRFLNSDQGNVYPFRYGQPFIDAIFNLLKQDARGATSAILRIFNNFKLPCPQIFFKSTWVITHTESNMVIADELFQPCVESIWVDLQGHLVDKDNQLSKLLEVPYKDKRTANIYSETNIRSEIWPMLQKEFDLSLWRNWVNQSVKCSKEILQEKFKGDLQFTLVSLQAQIYLSQS